MNLKAQPESWLVFKDTLRVLSKLTVQSKQFITIAVKNVKYFVSCEMKNKLELNAGWQTLMEQNWKQ